MNEKRGTCWVGYQQIGMKKKGNRMVPNCVKEIVDIYWETELGEGCGYTFEFEKQPMEEAEYQGRKVTLNKPFLTPDGPKKRSVYVKNEKGNVVKVNFGDPNMKIKKNDPARRKSFRARHGCDKKKSKLTASYWACKDLWAGKGGSTKSNPKGVKGKY